MEFKLSNRDILSLTFCVGLVQIAIYYLAGATIRGDGGFSIAQPDTLLYCQAARRIVEGHAFSFSEGTAVCTGTTSVLYPFVLAILYLLGCAGDALIRAGFFLNAVFYLVFLSGWSLVSFRLFRKQTWKAFACLLLASFGPFAYCALAQSDTGLWLAISSYIAWGLLSDKRVVYAPLLIVAPWIRPEGMMLSAAFGGILCWRLIARWFGGAEGSMSERKDLCRDILVLAGALASTIGVFALNHTLTGHCQFASVSNKGYFKYYPIVQAVYASAIDAMQILKAYVLGITRDAPRDFMVPPFVGACSIWLGLFAMYVNKVANWRMCVWLLAVLVSFATVATSGWQDKNLDRYLAWIWPTLIILMVEGWASLECRFSNARIAQLLAMFHLCFFAGMSVVFCCAFYYSGDKVDRVRAFASQCEELMEPGEAIGVWSHSGTAYEFSARRVAHLCGIYSPEFLSRTPVSALETLKRNPDTRFRYYFYKVDEDPTIWAGAQDVVLSRQLAIGPEGCELREASWDSFDRAERTPSAPEAGASLVDRVDVGYEKDEVSHGYGCLPCYHMPTFAPFTLVGKLGSDTIVEGGRFVFGADEMIVCAQPGKDLHVVMRTYPEKRVRYERDLDKSTFDFRLNESLTLGLAVDGHGAGTVDVLLKTNEFTDVSFTIPGAVIDSERPRISILGAHITCGYWFYQ